MHIMLYVQFLLLHLRYVFFENLQGHPIHFIQPSLLVFLLRKTPQKETPKAALRILVVVFFRQCESWWCFLWEGRQGPPGRWREPIPGWLLNPTNKSYFLLKESVRLNLGCTPPKTNMDTQKWWFGKGASFWIWPFLGIYAEFLGVVFVCQPFSSGTFARFRSFSLNSLTH